MRPRANGNNNGRGNCVFCEEPDDDLMLQCVTCSRWFHNSCIAADSINVPNWNCGDCTSSSVDPLLQQNKAGEGDNAQSSFNESRLTENNETDESDTLSHLTVRRTESLYRTIQRQRREHRHEIDRLKAAQLEALAALNSQNDRLLNIIEQRQESSGQTSRHTPSTRVHVPSTTTFDVSAFKAEALSVLSSTLDRLISAKLPSPSQLMLALVDDLYRCPTMTSLTDPKLRDFSIQVNNFVANIKALGRTEELRSGITLEKLTQKLYVLHHLEWKKMKSERDDLSIEDFAAFIKRKVKEIPDEHLHRRPRSPCLKRAKVDHDQKKSRVNAHHQAPNAPSTSTEACDAGCYKCGSSHTLSNCHRFIKSEQPERYRFVSLNGICFACLESRDHQWKDCPKRRQCGEEGCTENHHRLPHVTIASRFLPSDQNVPAATGISSAPTSSDNFTPQPQVTQQPASEDSTLGSYHQLSHFDDDEVLFKIVPVKLYGGNDSYVDTFAFLDDGSSLTLLDSELCDLLQLTGTSEKLRLKWTKGITRDEDSFRTTVAISSATGKNIHSLSHVYAVKNLDLPVQNTDAEALKKRFAHLRGLPIPSLKNAKPKLLIGLKHSKLLTSRKSFEGKDDEPIACKTRLGWIVFGTTTPSFGTVSPDHLRSSEVRLSLHDAVRSDNEPHKLVKFFSTDNFGVTLTKRDLISFEHHRPDNMVPLPSGLCKMFHQVKIIPEDKQRQRFLWRDGDESRAPTASTMERITFGLTRSPICAQHVSIHAQRYASECPKAVDGICNRTYIDDYLNSSHEDVDTAFKVSSDASCSSMGFDPRGFQSSHQQLLQRLPNENIQERFSEDASERAFAATAFFRFTHQEKVFIAHVMGKAKVAPIEQLTVPHLELQAAGIGAETPDGPKVSFSYHVSARFQASLPSPVQVIAFQLRLVKYLRGVHNTTEKFITPPEFRRAEVCAFREIQASAELRCSSRNMSPPVQHPSVKRKSHLYTLRPFLRDGITRLQSRAPANVLLDARNPLILSNKLCLVDLFIAHQHENFRMGEESPITRFRERVCVIDIRSSVQPVEGNCQLCKMLIAKPVMPRKGQLITPCIDSGAKPFTHDGLYASGPCLIDFGRYTTKRYGLILTSLTYPSLAPNIDTFGEKKKQVAAILEEVPVNELHSRAASRRAQHLVEKSTRHWVSEHIPYIMRRSKWLDDTKPIGINDIVIVTNPSTPNPSWKKEHVTNSHPGTSFDLLTSSLGLPSTQFNISIGSIAV